ncbi:hypothetical protein QEV69_04375 [Trueperella pyogenes]|uniref:hypothetical protein n=1 Tax=Trueperella pyogenes TaxID=1661 RepID=UPI003253E3C8
MFDHHATTDFASRITHPHIQTTSNQSFRHHTNEKYAQKQHKMANLEVESDRLKKHQTPPHQQKTRNQQHKMAYKPYRLSDYQRSCAVTQQTILAPYEILTIKVGSCYS